MERCPGLSCVVLGLLWRTAAVSPPARCTDELPSAAFPGTSPASSSAAWPSGAQPQGLECWPRDPETGLPGACAGSVTVLEDADSGWPGTCLGLASTPSHSANECEEQCRAQAVCEAFQWTTAGECWHGQGTNCYKRDNFVPGAAKRFEHGSVRVLKDLRGWQIFGLSQVFEARAGGFFADDGAAADHCKMACYSSITCAYWTYNTEHGCWIEDAGVGSVAYPLTMAAATNASDFARGNIAGEYVQHICPGHDGFFFPVLEAIEVAEHSFASWQRWQLVLLVAALAVVFCACLACLLRSPDHPKRRTERGLELATPGSRTTEDEGTDLESGTPLLNGVDVGARDAVYRHTLDPVASASLVLNNPHLVSLGTLGNPLKLMRLLHNCEVGPLDDFVSECPADTLAVALPKLLSGLSNSSVTGVLAPLLNNPLLHPVLIAMLVEVDTDIIIQLLNGAPADCLGVVLQASPSAMTKLVKAVYPEHVEDMLVPVNDVPVAVLDMVTALHEPERAGAVVNYVDPEVLVWLLDEVAGSTIAGIMNAVRERDFEESGTFIRFLQALEGERGLCVEKVAPFVQLVPGKVLGQLIMGVSPEKLLEVLRRVGPEGVSVILSNTNVDLIIRMWNGPLEQAVSFFAGGLSEVEKHRLPGKAIKKVTDNINRQLQKYDRKVRRGQQLRHARQDSMHRPGDFRRGLMGDLRYNLDALRCHPVHRQSSSSFEVGGREEGHPGLRRSNSF